MKKELGIKKIPRLQARDRYFQGLPVREARGDILVQPNRTDIKNAVRNDPERCAYANCIKRMLETKRVWVFTSVAYVEALDEVGSPILERYMVKDHAHSYIQRFDAGEEVNPGGFILHKPQGSKTLEYKRRMSQSYAKNNPEKKRQYAHDAYERQKKRGFSAPTLRQELTGTFRDGTGCVKFIGTADGYLKVNKLAA